MVIATAACWTGSARVADRVRAFDLGIDTASDDASLALFAHGEDEPLAVHAFRPETTMTRVLVGEVAGFLERAGVERSEVARIAVTIGPGQYGGLRAGIALAQGMAVALDVPLAGVGRLLADAARAEAPAGLTVAAVHLTRTGPAWAAYAAAAPGDVPRELVPPALTSYEDATQTAPRPAAWTGELDEALAAARDAERRTGDTVAEARAPRAVAVVRLARALDAFGDPALVDAVYLRPPPITKPRNG
jgi:tRNA threonylcarbamoyladenosine biosynthesis protein TsaB